MKSRTSFFNFTILKKDITRFFPIWGVYSVILMLVYITQSPLAFTDLRYALYMLDDLLYSIAAVNMIYAGLSAMMLFGDLYKAKLCNALHAMPVRREGWFLTHMVAALLFCAVPNILYAIFITPMLDTYWYLAFVVLGISLMQFIGFFGVGAFAAMCAGTKFGMLVSYLAINLGSALLTGFAELYIYPLMYGVRFNENALVSFSPFAYIVELEYLDIYLKAFAEAGTNFNGFIRGDFLKLTVMTAAGLGLLGGALLLYRHRKLEKAGDFMAIRPAAVVFQILFCLLTGLIFKGISGNYIVGFLGITVGFFGGSMLLQRKVGVFKKRTFAMWGVVMASVALILLGARIDPLGLAGKVPKAEQVKSVTISDTYGIFHIETETPEDVKLFLQMHQKIVDERPKTSSYEQITFEYELTGGRTMQRTYPITEDELDRSALNAYYTDWRRLFGVDDWTGFCNNITYVRISGYRGYQIIMFSENKEDYQGKAVDLTDPIHRNEVVELMEAVKSESGKAIPSTPGSNVDGSYVISVSAVQGTKITDCQVRISPECTESFALVKELMEKYYTDTPEEIFITEYVHG